MFAMLLPFEVSAAFEKSVPLILEQLCDSLSNISLGAAAASGSILSGADWRSASMSSSSIFSHFDCSLIKSYCCYCCSISSISSSRAIFLDEGNAAAFVAATLGEKSKTTPLSRSRSRLPELTFS